MISIITPVHKTSEPFLTEAYASLLNQSLHDWEWVILENGGGKVPPHISFDKRVKVYQTEDDNAEHNRIGRLKGIACSMATGDILVELDADDMLTPSALAEIEDAFSDYSIAMVYSNSAEFNTVTWKSTAYSDYYGWRHRTFSYQGHSLKEMIAWPPGPWMMRRVEWAPNHVRAWRKKDYDAIGGHNQELRSGDDHDLCCRTYIAHGGRRMKHIDKCLYLYRLHGDNSCKVFNHIVQAQTLQNYLKYSREIIIKWAMEENLRTLDLGGRLNAWPEFETVDLMGADIITDLNETWPFEDNSVGVLRASHIFEHLIDPVHTMNEAFRVLAPGGWLLLEVPSTDGRGAFQDPTHVSFWNENSIWYYTNQDFARFIPGFKGKFQDSRTITFFPSEFEEQNNIPIVQSDLIALKPPYSNRHVGEIKWQL